MAPGRLSPDWSNAYGRKGDFKGGRGRKAGSDSLWGRKEMKTPHVLLASPSGLHTPSLLSGPRHHSRAPRDYMTARRGARLRGSQRCRLPTLPLFFSFQSAVDIFFSRTFVLKEGILRCSTKLTISNSFSESYCKVSRN